jgi:hypothetical protein
MMANNDSETVWIANASSSQPTRYHTRQDCGNYPKNDRPTTLGEARKRGLGECRFCSGEADTGGGSGRNTATVLREIGEEQHG